MIQKERRSKTIQNKLNTKKVIQESKKLVESLQNILYEIFMQKIQNIQKSKQKKTIWKNKFEYKVGEKRHLYTHRQHRQYIVF